MFQVGLNAIEHPFRLFLNRPAVYLSGTGNKHETIAAAKDFKLTESEFEDFKKYIADKEYNYSTASEQALEELKGNRIGIVVFGGESFVQLPITTDYSAAKLFLSTITTDIMPVQGTAIGSAIDLSLESFDYENGTQKARN